MTANRTSIPFVGTCPCCTSSRIVGTSSIELSRVSMEQDLECINCGATWTAVVAFTIEESETV
jgi:hypothetical protein